MNLLTELLTIQGSLAAVSREELLRQANDRGAGLSERQLTSIIGEGVFPQGARFGTGPGQWPVLSIDLLVFIGRQRQANTSVASLRELVPIWCYIEGARRKNRLELAEFERVVRQNIRRVAAAFWIPWLLGGLLGGSDDLVVTRDGEPVKDSMTVVVGTMVEGEPKVFGEFTMPVARMAGESSTVNITVDP